MAVATNKQKAHQRRRQQDRRNSASPLLEIMPKLSVLAAALDAMSAASRGGRGGGGSTSDFIRSTSAEVHWPKVPERGPYAAIDGICGAARHTARSPRSPHDGPNFAMISYM
jgi:hypothetical protein